MYNPLKIRKRTTNTWQSSSFVKYYSSKTNDVTWGSVFLTQWFSKQSLGMAIYLKIWTGKIHPQTQAESNRHTLSYVEYIFANMLLYMCIASSLRFDVHVYYDPRYFCFLNLLTTRIRNSINNFKMHTILYQVYRSTHSLSLSRYINIALRNIYSYMYYSKPQL